MNFKIFWLEPEKITHKSVNFVAMTGGCTKKTPIFMSSLCGVGVRVHNFS